MAWVWMRALQSNEEGQAQAARGMACVWIRVPYAGEGGEIGGASLGAVRLESPGWERWRWKALAGRGGGFGGAWLGAATLKPG
eukprot:359847-Chlamydomonas_euryale.AAC.3